jgi:hypothetical protein
MTFAVVLRSRHSRRRQAARAAPTRTTPSIPTPSRLEADCTLQARHSRRSHRPIGINQVGFIEEARVAMLPRSGGNYTALLS